MRYSVLIAPNRDRRREALDTLCGEMKVAIELRERVDCRIAKPQDQDAVQENERGQQPKTAEKQQPRPAATARYGAGVRFAIRRLKNLLLIDRLRGRHDQEQDNAVPMPFPGSSESMHDYGLYWRSSKAAPTQ